MYKYYANQIKIIIKLIEKSVYGEGNIFEF